jgi:hypothetical protein
MATSKFTTAETFIQLRRHYAPKSWGDLVIRINEMILSPLITIFLLLIRKSDLLSAASVAFNAYNAWTGFLKYNELRFEVQRMYLQTMVLGGPFITTNNNEYLPYVFADAVTRHDMRRQHSG